MALISEWVDVVNEGVTDTQAGVNETVNSTRSAPSFLRLTGEDELLETSAWSQSVSTLSQVFYPALSFGWKGDSEELSVNRVCGREKPHISSSVQADMRYCTEMSNRLMVHLGGVINRETGRIRRTERAVLYKAWPQTSPEPSEHEDSRGNYCSALLNNLWLVTGRVTNEFIRLSVLVALSRAAQFGEKLWFLYQYGYKLNINISAVKRLIASKINVFVYIKYVCVCGVYL